jgi:shikimate dehydrogenase
MKYLDEIHPTAKKIGAVNTIVNKNGKLIGYNTDCEGAINPLKERTQINGKKVYLLGAGGAARAILCGLIQEGAKVTIYNRTFEHAQKLAEEFNCEAKELSEIDSNCDVIINTTPVGMWPNTNESPIEERFLKKGMIVFDTVYNPLETNLIKYAKRKDCKTILGVEMFLNQAYTQFELFFLEKPPKELMRKVLLKELKKRQKQQNLKK